MHYTSIWNAIALDSMLSKITRSNLRSWLSPRSARETV